MALTDDDVLRRLRALRDEVEAAGQDVLAYLIDLAILEAERYGTVGPRPAEPVASDRPRYPHGA